MSASKFKFISPGVFLEEIDQSRLPRLPDVMGPLIIGTADKGPAFQPVKVASIAELISVFGQPSSGAASDDPSRYGVQSLGVDYGAWAARAYLRNNSPLTFVRVLGSEHPNKESGGEAGWNITAADDNGDPRAGAYALYVSAIDGLDSLRLPCRQNVEDAAAHVLEIAVPDVPNPGGAADTLSIALQGAAMGGDEKVVAVTIDLTENADPATAPGLRAEAAALAIQLALNALPELTAEVDANDSKKVLVTGPDNGDRFSIPFADEPDAMETAPLLITEKATGISAVELPAGGVTFLRFTPKNGAPINVSATNEEIATFEDKSSASMASILASIINATPDMSEHLVASASGDDVLLEPRAADGDFVIFDDPVAANGGRLFNVSTAVKTKLNIALVVGAGPQDNFTAAMSPNQTQGDACLAAILHARADVNLKIHATQTGVASSVGGMFTLISTESGGDEERVEFCLDYTKNKFLRGPLETNPTSINETVVGAANQSRYFLAQSFEGALLDKFGAELNGNNLRAQLLRTSAVTSDYRREQTPAETPWIRSQHMGALSSWSISNTKPLFKLVALDTGESGNRFKVSIENISVPTGNAKLINPYCSFSVVIRHWSAEKEDVVKTYTGCNLDPSSESYVARKIGDQHLVWDHKTGRMERRGLFSNKDSQFRVEVSSEVASGAASPELVPSSYMGPEVLATIAQAVESRATKTMSAAMRLRKSSVGFDRGRPQSDALFGIDTNLRSNGSPTDKPDASYIDLTKPLHTGASTITSFVFSLELLKAGTDDGNGDSFQVNGAIVDEDTKCFYYDLAGKTTTGQAISERGVGAFDLTAQNLLVATEGIDGICSRVAGFTLPVTGGTDGFDIRQLDPICDRVLSDAGGSETLSAPYYTVTKAISAVSDPEFVEYNILSAPGITVKGLTDRMLQVAESRGDALAVIDMPGIYTPSTSEFRASESRRLGDITGLASEVKERAYNSSYGCTYAPWILVQDNAGKPLWLPPSVAGIGTMGSSSASSEVWFAPAGFNRGGLHEGASGLSVMGVSHHLTSKQRDDLYDVCVNPIASFPSENIVIFGQKTLQGFPSALDRINVRRLLIHVKKRVSQISRGLLFEPNIESTWLKFRLPVEEFLSTIQSGGGLTDYRVVLDDTTTTPDLIDRNIMYAKVLLKPARAIEYIAVDFVVMNTGASFDD